jgi:hypothetical protein
LPEASDSNWPDMKHPVVDCMAGLFDRQVYGIEIEFA